MRLFGKRIPLGGALLFWFIVWEVVGRVGVSSIFPPLSRVVVAGMTVVATEKFRQAAEISLRSFAVGMVVSVDCRPRAGHPDGAGGKRRTSPRHLGECLRERPDLRPGPDPHGDPGDRRDDGRGDGLPVRRLRHHPRHAGGDSKGGSVADRDGPLVRGAAVSDLHEDPHLERPARDPGRVSVSGPSAA